MFQSSDNSKNSTLHDSRAGMTLIELIITLSIMAAVASIALVTLSDMGEASRYDETERRGLAAQRAVIGQPGEISRFFNDMGRYPMVLVDIDPNDPEETKKDLRAKLLAELYDIEVPDLSIDATLVRSYYCEMPIDLWFDFNLDGTREEEIPVSSFTFTNVYMQAGWNGPYLLNSHDKFTDHFTDKFNTPWSINTNDSAALDDSQWLNDPNAGDEIRAMRSEFYDYTTHPDLVSQFTYPFHETKVFVDLKVKLQVKNDSAWVDPPSMGYQYTRVLIYVPYCTTNYLPKLCEITAWQGDSEETGDPVHPEGARYRLTGDVDPAYEQRAYDKNLPEGFSASEIMSNPIQPPALSPVRVLPVEAGDAPAWSTDWTEVTYRNVPVGSRIIWAYVHDGTRGQYVRPQTFKITPGDNVVTLYLNEPF